MQKNQEMPIKAYSKKELRLKYTVGEDTFRQWLNAIKDKLPHYNPKCKLLSPLQVRVIFEHYGELQNP